MNQDKILIVEDDKFLLNAFKLKFLKAGFEVLTATDGALAEDILKTETPDLILLDLMMPNKNGFDFLTDRLSDEKLKKIPVFVASNLGQDNDIDKAKSLGADGYLVKSDTPISQVVEKIKEFINSKKLPA